MASDSDPSDAFMPEESSGYSSEKYYTRATNSRGFDKSVKVVNVPPELLGAIHALIESGRTPYRTVADFFRDSLVHAVNLRQRQLKDGQFSKEARIFTRLSEAERLKSLSQTARDLLKSREEHLREERDPEILAVIIAQCEEDIEFMPSEYYKDEMRSLIAKMRRDR